MKKTISAIASMGLFSITMLACNNSSSTDLEKIETAVTITDTIPTSQATLPSHGEQPKLSNEEVNQSLAELLKLKRAYLLALKNKEHKEIMSLNVKYSTWSKNASTLSSKLKPEETEKYDAYVTKLKEEWANAVQTTASN